jgi:hypothetical protein
MNVKLEKLQNPETPATIVFPLSIESFLKEVSSFASTSSRKRGKQQFSARCYTMGKKKGLNSINSNDKKRKPASSPLTSFPEFGQNGNEMFIDPARIRFQHSRIRPFFSGCGRSVTATLEEIRNGTIQVSDLPPIQVIVGPSTSDNNCVGDHKNTDEPWYFSLNNRRLWVLKRLREEGFLERYGNKVFVRVRMPKSQQEEDRYCVENCALEAKIVPEKNSDKNTDSKKTRNRKFMNDDDSSLDDVAKAKSSGRHSQESIRPDILVATSHWDKSDDDEDDCDGNMPSNRFSALLC